MPPERRNSTVILLVEDNPVDQKLIRRAGEKPNLRKGLRIVKDGEEADGFDHVTGLVQAIEKYWFETAVLPPKTE